MRLNRSGVEEILNHEQRFGIIRVPRWHERAGHIRAPHRRSKVSAGEPR